MTQVTFNFAPSEPTPSMRAAKARDRGIRRAVEHADRVKSEWSKRAIESLLPIIARQTGSFLFEDLIAEVEAPPDKRAFGAVVRELARMKVIRKVGYAPARTSHLSPKVLWSKV